MPSFAYVARRGSTDKLTGIIDAADRNEAAARLRRQGCFIISMELAKGNVLEGGTLSRHALRRISKEDISIFTSQLASLLKAGLSVSSALKSLQEQQDGAPLASVIEHISRAVSESLTLSESMARFPRLFPRTYTSVVRAGEEGGMLAEVLGRLSANLKAEIEVRGRVRGALAYPVFLCIFGILTVTVLMTFVIPRFTKLFVTMGERLPLPTMILLGFSNFMEKYCIFVLVGFAVMVFATITALKQESVRIVADRWLLVVPYAGSIIKRAEIARFARTLSELLKSGVPILTSLQITQEVMTNRCFVQAVNELRTGVSKGHSVAKLLKDLPGFTPLVVSMVSVGEESGQLPELLLEVSEIYEKECERSIQAFTTILGPSLIVVLGGVIAFVIVAILLPIFEASTMVG